MNRISKYIAISCASAGLYALAFWHGSHHYNEDWEQAKVSVGYWSERTNLFHSQEALKVLRPTDNREAFDLVARSYCRSVVAMTKYRKGMDPEYWDIDREDDRIDGYKDFIAKNPSVTHFAKNLDNGPEVAPMFRKSTYTDLFDQIRIPEE